MIQRLFPRILFILLILIIILSIAVYFYAKPVLLSIANKELQKIFKKSSISSLKIAADYIEFQGVEIQENNSYHLKIKEARIYYSLRSIFKKGIERIEGFRFNITSFKTDLFEIEGAALSADRNKDAGEFYIKAVNYNKLKIGDVTGKSELKGNILNIDPILVSFLGGSVNGRFNISLDQDLNYTIRLNTQGLEIKRFVDEMKFDERFDMTGRLDGEFYLSGRADEIKDIKGDFNTKAPGGVLIIKDKTFLENIAKQSNQPLDIIVESFRNYNYNNGIIKLFMEDGNIALDLKLDGKNGKRSLTVTLHDFNKGKERQ